MSFAELVARNLFEIVAAIGRPIGGVRPHRLAHRLSQIAYGKTPPRADQYRWYTDRHGLKMRLHPYFLIDREIIAFGTYELPLQRFIEKNIRPGMVCMDVGANMGAMTLHLALRVGESGQVFAFEPVPTNAQRLREHVAGNGFDNRVHVLENALSDADATMQFAIASQAHVNQGMGSLVEVDHADLTKQITVQSLRLDSFCQAQSLSQLDFIKVDIQGAEPLFLAGAVETIRRLRPRIIMEVASSSLGSGGCSSRDLLSKMSGLGYSAFTLKKSGDRGIRLDADTCPPDFTAENVLFEAA